MDINPGPQRRPRSSARLGTTPPGSSISSEPDSSQFDGPLRRQSRSGQHDPSVPRYSSRVRTAKYHPPAPRDRHPRRLRSTSQCCIERELLTSRGTCQDAAPMTKRFVRFEVFQPSIVRSFSVPNSRQDSIALTRPMGCPGCFARIKPSALPSADDNYRGKSFSRNGCHSVPCRGATNPWMGWSRFSITVING